MYEFCLEQSDMGKKNFTTSRKLFLKITLILFTVSIIVVYFSSIYMRNVAFHNLAEDDAQKTSELAFEVLYTKMQEGWAREDLYKIIDRLNNLKPGLKIQTYRSDLVKELFGEVEAESAGLRDPLVQKALKGETQFLAMGNHTIRYIRPMVVKQECITCHYNAKVGDINGVIDMTFPQNDIKISLDSIIIYFLIFTVIAIILTFFIFQFLMTRTFINPITLLVESIKKVKDSGDFSEQISYEPKTYEMYILGDSFNALLAKVEDTMQVLREKNKMLEEHKKAIDKSTIVSKADTKGIITYVNDKFCEISGYTKEELLGQNHNIVRSPHMPKEAFEDLWRTIQSKKTWQGVVENRAKDGSSYFVQATIMPILDENDEIVEYIGIRQDITELTKLQFNEMSESVDKALDIKLQEVVNLIPLRAVVIDEESKIFCANRAFEEMFTKLDHIKLDELFIEKEGYLFSDALLDWKDDILNFHSANNKVLLNIFDEERAFSVYLEKLDANDYYLVLFVEIDKSTLG